MVGLMTEDKYVSMVTQDEIGTIEGFNLPLLQEAMRQTELKIKDEDDRKKRIDSRVYNLLTPLFALIAILSGATQYIENGIFLFTVVNVTAVFLITAIALLLQNLKSQPYGGMGTPPHCWLMKDYISSNRNDNYMLSIAIARILQSFQGNIEVSDRSNSKRATMLDLALVMGQCALIPFFIFFIKNILIGI